MDTLAKVQHLRNQLPAVSATTYLNTGTAGPLPLTVAQAMEAASREELQRGRASIESIFAFFPHLAAARREVEVLLNAPAGSVALTHNTSEAVNIVLWGIDWQPGDEVITSTLEHEAIVVPLALLRQRRRVVTKFAPVGLGEKVLPAIKEAIGHQTKLIAISHLAYSSGARFPLAEIVELAHRHRIMVLVDGAQTAGAVPLDVQASAVDFYTVSGQKWLCGPEGTGALYVRPDRMDVVQPTFASYFSVAKGDPLGNIELSAGAMRYECGMVYRPGIIGFAASVRWIREEVSVPWSAERIGHLAAYCRQQLEKLPGLNILTPQTQQSCLVNFTHSDWPPDSLPKVVQALARRGIVIRSIPHQPYCLRASIAWFNTTEEIDLLVSALSDILRHGTEDTSRS